MLYTPVGRNLNPKKRLLVIQNLIAFLYIEIETSSHGFPDNRVFPSILVPKKAIHFEKMLWLNPFSVALNKDVIIHLSLLLSAAQKCANLVWSRHVICYLDAC